MVLNLHAWHIEMDTPILSQRVASTPDFQITLSPTDKIASRKQRTKTALAV
ncbi:hypothetical protein DAI22_02g201000 [Oryza sativa Japonica Group]|nr:hypothetical protein DAI22_02g201000 [Oryza sativa Japonica Group]